MLIHHAIPENLLPNSKLLDESAKLNPRPGYMQDLLRMELPSDLLSSIGPVAQFFIVLFDDRSNIMLPEQWSIRLLLESERAMLYEELVLSKVQPWAFCNKRCK